MIDPQNMDYGTRFVSGVLEHWYIFVALVIAGKWGLPYALRIAWPPMLKTGLDAYFTNGGGDKVRAIMKSENESQSRMHKEELDRRFKEHEQEEKARFSDGAKRMLELEDAIEDILRRRRRARR